SNRLVVIFCLLVLYSCHKESTNSDSTTTDVYVAGYVVKRGINGDSSVATYWKNGNAVTLSDGSFRYAPAHSIFVSGGDVYAAGTESNGNRVMATYWKNGQRVPLSDGSKDAGAISIVVSGKDVYVAGWEYNNCCSVTPKYWKNGHPVTLGVAFENT